MANVVIQFLRMLGALSRASPTPDDGLGIKVRARLDEHLYGLLRGRLLAVV